MVTLLYNEKMYYNFCIQQIILTKLAGCGVSANVENRGQGTAMGTCATDERCQWDGNCKGN